jgi:hypothetical protein
MIALTGIEDAAAWHGLFRGSAPAISALLLPIRVEETNEDS